MPICLRPDAVLRIFSPGDRVTEEGHPDIVLVVRSCDERGYTRAERWESLPDGRKLHAWTTNAPAASFTLFARAGDTRPDPAPKIVAMRAVDRVRAMYDGRIPKDEYEAARQEDAEAAAALLALDGESVPRQAAE